MLQNRLEYLKIIRETPKREPPFSNIKRKAEPEVSVPNFAASPKLWQYQQKDCGNFKGTDKASWFHNHIKRDEEVKNE